VTAAGDGAGLVLRRLARHGRAVRPLQRAGAAMDGRAPKPVGTQWPASSLLGRLSEPARSALLGLGTAAGYPAGRRLVRLGEPGQSVFLLLAGCVKILGNDGERDPLLGIRVGGDLVGEMAVLSSLPRSATVTTCSLLSTRVIPGPDLLSYLMDYPDAALAVATMISERLRWANERRVDFTGTDPRTRICRVLLTLAETYGRESDGARDLGAPLTQDEIASLAGVRLATAEKALRGFANDGLVRLGYRNIAVLDLARLREAAALRGRH
jgi:CRP/FNR family cyclic AMP-dependent transcriptional regulator